MAPSFPKSDKTSPSPFLLSKGACEAGKPVLVEDVKLAPLDENRHTHWMRIATHTLPTSL